MAIQSESLHLLMCQRIPDINGKALAAAKSDRFLPKQWRAVSVDICEDCGLLLRPPSSADMM